LFSSERKTALIEQWYAVERNLPRYAAVGKGQTWQNLTASRKKKKEGDRKYGIGKKKWSSFADNQNPGKRKGKT